ncbi:serine/threonine-protein kinase-like protein ACR4 [Diospyros lotus]|uniref:serine/threonine-protein kinase-like protein ACR4 n=1 Tax=Diospyros lotus TaxID=55363 RepID=UPI002259C604|nr:serine/threonine-protein kinase-like protein ACR4 [Diospyros lotus]
MSHGEEIAYDAVMAMLSFSLIILSVILFCLWKKKPVDDHYEEIMAAKACASPYSLMDIDAATDGFNRRRIIGQGRLGTVYAAVLPNGELVAVKRIHPRLVLSNAASFGFSSMLKWLSLAHHPNIVPILGFSEAPAERIFVMEFVSMVNLDYYLHQNSDAASLLDWGRRLRIAAGVARGVEYLHEVAAPPILHGCIKPSNILVDVKFVAKLCDYGLSSLASQERRGLEGYVDEEYWAAAGRRGASKESDVYGFGVVLLELLSGRCSEGGLLANWALPLIKEMKLGELLDPRLVIPSDMKPLVRLAKVASACVGNCRKNRPSIVQVAAILNNLEMGVMGI